ncbi:MAG: GAF domain-containing protein [Chloroflexi bacterium]|nr:GAF domain-containing protein [Chloroflexota bacterium]
MTALLNLWQRFKHAILALQRDLGVRLLALYVAFVLPLIGMVLYFDHVATQRLRSDVETANLTLASTIAQETNLTLGSLLSAAQHLGSEPAVLESDVEGMRSLFAALVNDRPEVNLVYRLDAQGIMRYHYPEEPISTVGADFSFRPYFKRAQNSRLPFFSRGRISPTTNQAVVTAVMPLWDEHQNFLGIVGINVRLESLSWVLENISAAHKPEEAFVVYIVDNIGQVVASPNSHDLLTTLDKRAPALLTLAHEGQAGNAIVNQDNHTMLYSYAPIRSAEWGVVVGRSTESAFATINLFRHATHLALAVVVITGVLFWFGLSTQVIRPIEQLAAYSKAIGQDGPHDPKQQKALERLYNRPDQVGHLARTLVRMEADIAARLQELRTLLQTSAEVASTLDSRTVLSRILAQVERLLNVQKCAIIAWDEQKQAFVARASRGLSARYAERLIIPRDEFNSLTLRALQTGKPLQISDTETDPSAVGLRPRARAEGYRAVLAVPLPTQHTPPAALVVYYPEPHTFTQQEIDLLTSFANHAAMAIENAALFARSDARLQEQTRRLEALIQSMSDAILLEDHNGRVLYANRRLAELAELPPDEISGVEVDRILARIIRQAQNPTAAHAALQRAVEEGMAEIALRRQGRLTDWRVQFFSVTDVQGVPIGRGQIWKDITADREVDRMKASLMSTVSHELRTPLAAIKGYVSTLLAEDVNWDPESQREFLQTISEETDRLSQLVTDLLDLSRIEGGSLKVRREAIDLAALIQRAAQNAHPAPGENLRVQIPEHMPPLFADPRHIEVVLRNLIENAVKYGGEESPIQVSVTVESDQVVVRVEDEGPGIPPEHIPHIFESFYRVESGLTRQASGAGLGLAICRGFVEAHGGKIWVEPRAKGTCIAFSLPLTPPDDTTA